MSKGESLLLTPPYSPLSTHPSLLTIPHSPLHYSPLLLLLQQSPQLGTPGPAAPALPPAAQDVPAPGGEQPPQLGATPPPRALRPQTRGVATRRRRGGVPATRAPSVAMGPRTHAHARTCTHIHAHTHTDTHATTHTRTHTSIFPASSPIVHKSKSIIPNSDFSCSGSPPPREACKEEGRPRHCVSFKLVLHANTLVNFSCFRRVGWQLSGVPYLLSRVYRLECLTS